MCAPLPGTTAVPSGQLGSPANPIVIVFEPYIDQSRTVNAARMVGDCLSKATGLAYRTEVAASPYAAVEALGARRAHVGFLDIPAIVQGRAKYAFDTGLISLRTEKDHLMPTYQRQFIARKASGIHTIADLRGKTFCFGEPQSSFGAIVPRIVLAANGIDPAKDLRATRFAGYADQIARAVYSGECDAGTTFVDVLTDPATALTRILPDILDKVGVF
jgi:phosphonate transport system substrate-binding protein